MCFFKKKEIAYTILYVYVLSVSKLAVFLDKVNQNQQLCFIYQQQVILNLSDAYDSIMYVMSV